MKRLLREDAQVMLMLALMAFAAALVMRYVTRLGAGVDYDSMYYLQAARTWLDGLGFGRITALGVFEPMTHYPPGYSLALAGLALTGMPLFSAARLLCLLSFAGVVALTGLLAWRASLSRLLALWAALIALTSSALIGVSAWALTEAPFLCLALAALLFLERYFMTRRLAWLVAGAFVAAAACLTRYAGVALVAVAVLALLLDRRDSLRQCSAHAAGFAALTLAPLAVWILRNMRLSGLLADRRFGWTPLPQERIYQLYRSVDGWFLPESLTGMKVFYAIGLILALLLALALRSHDPFRPAAWLAALFFTFYPLVILVSMATYDPSTPLDNRILIPVFIGLVVVLAVALARLWRSGQALRRAIAVGMAAVLLVGGAHKLPATVQRLAADGLGYTGLPWNASATAIAARDLPSTLIYTNNLAAIYFVAGKTSIGVPGEHTTEAELQEMRANLHMPGAYLVIFRPLTGEFAIIETITAGMALFASYVDGDIYYFPQAAGRPRLIGRPVPGIFSRPVSDILP